METPTTWYAIWHKPTKTCMPQIMFRTASAGYTLWEPTGKDGLGGAPNSPPRLFKSYAGANQAMHYWLRGAVEVKTKESYQSWEFREVYKELIATPSGRNKEDVEVIAVTLTRNFL
jgi:hypothetical protein